MNDLAWQKSSYSSASGDNCVEVAPLPGGGRAIRDSKAPDAGLFVLTPAQWQTLRQAMRRVPVNAPRASRRGPARRLPGHRGAGCGLPRRSARDGRSVSPTPRRRRRRG